MNHRHSILITLLLLPFFAWGQQGSLSGKVTDIETGESLPGVSILIKGTLTGTVSGIKGEFTISTKNYPVTLIFSLIGFRSQEVMVIDAPEEDMEVELTSGTILGQEIVITASRIEESLLRSPVTIEKLDLRAIQETPSPGFYDALENVKGVQMTTSSITFKVPNTRGFNIPNNFRFVQVADGVDMQAGTLGVPLGNAIGPTELDIESVEITPGASSALYGMNAINGMANLATKNPFHNQGLSLYQKTGVNHIDRIDYEPGLLSETAIRYAKALNNRFAFKLNFSYLTATDWRGNSDTDQNPNSRASTANNGFPELNVPDHPAFDAWNKYGDDGGSNAVTVNGITYNGQPNQSFIIRRTGYWERDLVPSRVDNRKFDGAIHYRIGPGNEVSYAYRYGRMDGLFQRGNKIQLDNTVIQNHKVEFTGKYFSVRSYVSMEDTGDSYNLKPLSDNLELTHASNTLWGENFKSALQMQLDQGTDLDEAMRIARNAADAGRPVPGTVEFNTLKDQIIKVNNWDHLRAGVPTGTATGGAWLKQRSRMYHADALYNLKGKIKFIDMLAGADFRLYEIIPDGNNFVDFSRPVAERTIPLGTDNFGSNLYYGKVGVFTQFVKTLLGDNLKLTGSVRYDHNPEFDPKVNPRMAAVYSLAEDHHFRFTYQNGFRFPSLFEALSFVNNGNIRRVGGLSYINEGLNYLDNSYTLVSVNAFNAAIRNDEANGMERIAAALKHRALLVPTNLSPTRPERIDSFEAGYKGIFLNGDIMIDLDVYTNLYDGFLGQVEVAVPHLPSTDNPAVPGEQVAVGSDDAIVAMIQQNRNAQQVRYRVFTNAKNKYRNYGSALALTYNFYRKFTAGAIVNFNALSENNVTDVFVTGFNTPNWTFNLSLSNRELVKRLSFNVVYRWQQSFLWESPLANGTIPAYGSLDAQVSIKLPEIKSTIKVGGTNVLNERYIQYAAGPSIGGLYYIAITIDHIQLK